MIQTIYLNIFQLFLRLMQGISTYVNFQVSSQKLKKCEDFSNSILMWFWLTCIFLRMSLISEFQNLSTFIFQGRNWKSVCTFKIKYDLPAHLWWFLWYLPKSGPIASHGLAGFLGSRANPAGSRLRGEIFLSNWLKHWLKLRVLSSQRPKHSIWCTKLGVSTKPMQNLKMTSFQTNIETNQNQHIQGREPFFTSK